MQTLMEDYETHKVRRREKAEDNSVSLIMNRKAVLLHCSSLVSSPAGVLKSSAGDPKHLTRFRKSLIIRASDQECEQ